MSATSANVPAAPAAAPVDGQDAPPADPERDNALGTDQVLTLYAAVCADLRVRDDISFKLLGFVPLVSGSGAAVLGWLLQSKLQGPPEQLGFLGLLGAVVTFGLYVWELRNIQTCNLLRLRAAHLERSRLGLGKLAGRRDARRAFAFLRIGKTEGETIIYLGSMAAWLVPAAVGAGVVGTAAAGVAGIVLLVATVECYRQATPYEEVGGTGAMP